MRNFKYFLVLFVAIFFATSCEYVEFDPPVTPDEFIEAESNLVLKSASGFSSTTGDVFVQQGIGTGLKVESKTSIGITEATWKVEGTTYQGVQIAHRFNSAGEVPVEILAKFANGSTETRTFKVKSVVDISTADPIRTFVTSKTDGSWDVLILFSKERIRHATDNVFYYTGSVSEWQKKTIPKTDHNYVIGTNGQPAKTTDVGKYIGVTVNLKTRGEYSIALVHSGNNWADFSGSAFIKAAEPGLAVFWFDGGNITARGDSYVAENLPGVTGDGYFRFNQTGDETTGKVILYFHLDQDFTTSAFVVRELEGGTYSAPITMWPVDNYPRWGQIELPITEMLGKISGFRYGPNKNSPSTYSVNMAKSFFYDGYYKNIRIHIVKV